MDKHNISFEPMDIDLSANSNNDMDLSFDVSNTGIDAFLRKISDIDKSTPTSTSLREDTAYSLPSKPSASSNNILPCIPSIKKFHINIQKDETNTHSITKFKAICAALVIFLSAVVYHTVNIQCCDDINLDILRISLSKQLHGQTKAIDALVEGLTLKESKVLILYGSTGVGKTFAASVLLEQVGPHYNVYHYTMPSFMDTFSTDFMIGLTMCKNSIIIIDDLSPSDLGIEFHMKNLITKSENLDYIVTVILIYNNCNTAKDFKRQCDENFPAKIMDNLREVNAFKKIIRFETLNEEHLRKCIANELGHRKCTEEQITKVLQNFDAAVDGCKGVHSKIKLMDLS